VAKRAFLFRPALAGAWLLTLGAATCAMAAPTVAQQMQATQDGLARRCAALTARAGAAALASPAKADEPDPTAPARDMFCQCLPKAVAGLGEPDAGTTPENFGRRMQAAAEACSGQSTRRWMQQSCEKDPKPPVSQAQLKPYCDCFSTGLDALSDSAIAGASRQAYENFQRKVAARKAGEPEPAFEPSAIDALQTRCQGRHQ
jgi:hypothetical protein